MSKLQYRPQIGLDWWESLTIDEKVDYRKRFEIYRNRKDVIKNNYPNMYDLRNIRISKMVDKHVIRIWVFHDRI